MTEVGNSASGCPQCGRMVPPNRDRCLWCGAEVEETEEAPTDGGIFCPVCGAKLVEQQGENWSLLRCEAGHGVWMSVLMLERLEEMHDAAKNTAGFGLTPGAMRRLAGTDTQAGIQDPAQDYRHCPRCKNQMARRRYKKISSVVIDECLGHGVWFDEGELDRAIEFLEAGGLEASRQYEKENDEARARFGGHEVFLWNKHKVRRRGGWGGY